MNSMDWWIIGTLWVVIVGVIIFFVWRAKTYNKDIEIKKIANGNKSRVSDKARLFKDKNLVYWWKCQKVNTALGKLLPLPPSEAIEMTSKGKEVATGYLDETGQVVWQIDNTTNLKSYNIQPFTTKQRLLYSHGLKEAILRQKKSWMEHLATIVMGATFVIIVAILVFGYGELAKPILDAQELQTAQMASLEQIVSDQKDMSLGIQEIKTQIGLKNTPLDKGGTI